MFFGSSCTQTTGVPSAYRRQRLEQLVLVQRKQLLDADDGDVVVACAPRAPR